ncbi:MAG: hypothetical protein FWD46_05355 [Cystobacterineae bacterium]|nr:hypothetical protein [Cystobacterineae bacterium]
MGLKTQYLSTSQPSGSNTQKLLYSNTPSNVPQNGNVAPKTTTPTYRISDGFDSGNYVGVGSHSGGGGLFSMLDSVSKPTMPTYPGSNASEDEKKAYDQALIKYQEEMQTYNRILTAVSNMLQVEHDTKKAIIQNYRV